MGPRNHVLYGGSDPPCKGVILRGKGVVDCKVYGLSAVSCAKTAEQMEMLFGLLCPLGPRKHVLDGDAHCCHLENIIEPFVCGSNAALCIYEFRNKSNYRTWQQ